MYANMNFVIFTERWTKQILRTFPNIKFDLYGGTEGTFGLRMRAFTLLTLD